MTIQEIRNKIEFYVVELRKPHDKKKIKHFRKQLRHYRKLFKRKKLNEMG